jgi:lipopolysaccharide export system protein LptC
MPRLWRTLLVIACASILLLLLWRSPPKELSDLLTAAKPMPAFPSSYMTNAHTKQYNEFGQLSYTLQTTLVRFYEPRIPTDPEVVFDQPSLAVYEDNIDTPLWQISATSAEGNNKGDELQLQDNVVIRQQLANGHERLFTTSFLLVKPNRRYAETDKPVIIRDQSGTTQATGIKLFFDEKRIELLSHVESDYAAH